MSTLHSIWYVSAIIFNTAGVIVLAYVLALLVAWHIREFIRNKKDVATDVSACKKYVDRNNIQDHK